MLILPAIDLYEGKAVRLLKGDYAQMTVYSERPREVAADFRACGAQWIHMVDLEGARDGSTPTFRVVADIAQNSGLKVEIGGGIRSMQTVEKYLEAGVSRVILGTAAVKDPAFLKAAADRYGERIAVGADIKDGRIAIRGWLETSDCTAMDFCRQMQQMGIRTLICTDIDKDGAMKGTNHELYRQLQEELDLDLVASGGKTKNRLALWTDVVDPDTYGNYGFWDIQIEQGGEAVITNLGNSLAKIIQYNAANNPTLFACYQDRSQTPVCLYRRVPAMGDIEAIVAPFVNFGTTIETSGAQTIQINANRLTQDISVTHTNHEVFTLSADLLDRDGDNLTVSYDLSAQAEPQAGIYADTLVFTSGNVRAEAIVLLHLLRPLTIEQAVRSDDHAEVYLNPVQVTKKYDNYIYVRDNTGSMLLFDRGDGETGKRYGADLKAGDQLSGVTGRFINYFGVPEISPSEQFKVGQNAEVMPEQAGETIDSTDVCRYMVLDSVYVTSWTSLTYRGKEYAVSNKFKLPSFDTDCYTRAYVIVSYDHDLITLYIVSQEAYPDLHDATDNATSQLDAQVFMRDGVLFIRTASGTYTLHGTPLP